MEGAGPERRPARVIVHVEVGGRWRRIELARTAHGHDVWIDGRRLACRLDGRPPFWALLVDSSDTDGGAPRSYEVGVHDDHAAGRLLVTVDGRTVPVRVGDPSRRAGRRGGTGQVAGAQALHAPMPGRIVRVLVAAGDRVVPRQGLVVMEAMKMENELYAQMPGIVREVRVEPGSAVEAGALLVVVAAEGPAGT